MEKLPKVSLIFLFMAVWMPLIASAQFKIPEKPGLQTSVYDYAKILKDAEKQELEEKLIHYSDTTSTQIVVITVDSLAGESIGQLTPRWAHEWGIGQADKDNGVLILLAEAEHKIWISPGYGVDDRLTAGMLGQMIRDVIIPEFKKGSYSNGLNKGADGIFQLLQGKYRQKKPSDDKTVLDYICYFLIWFIIIGFPLALLIFRFKSKDDGDSSASSSYSSSGSSYSSGRSSGSSSHSGFSGGFGGGGFSGGGAGGSW